MKRVLILIVCFFISLIIAIKSFAETPVSGNITIDTNWTLSESPYIVTGSIQVYPGATLTIEPGVIVRFNTSTGLTIGGQLIAIGNESNKILFTSNQQNPQKGDWKYIYFTDSSTDALVNEELNYVSGNIIKYCVIEYAETGITCGQCTPYISNNIIRNNSNGGIYYYCAGDDAHGTLSNSGVISDNIIMNNSARYQGAGIYCNFASGKGSPCQMHIISNQIIANNAQEEGGGIYCAGANMNIDNNIITCNSATISGGGIRCAVSGGSSSAKNNIITNNSASQGGAISVSSNGFLRLSYCQISGNYSAEKGVISSNITLSYSNIYDNTSPYVIYNDYSSDVGAPNNWWGTTDVSIIQEEIFDYWDDLTRGEVLFDPISTQPNPLNIPDPGTICENPSTSTTLTTIQPTTSSSTSLEPTSSTTIEILITTTSIISTTSIFNTTTTTTAGGGNGGGGGGGGNPTSSTTTIQPTTSTSFALPTTSTSIVVSTSTTSVAQATTSIQPITTTTAPATLCPVEAIYGSDSEETKLLRVYRDKVLSKSASGRQMIKTYYELSPAVVEVLQNNDTARANTRQILDNLLPAIRKKVKQ